MTSNPTPDPARVIRAPWTPEQVDALNAFQQRGGTHPFTCGGEHTPGSPALVAYTDGWRCPQPYGESCDYRQDWAHAFMAAPAVSSVVGQATRDRIADVAKPFFMNFSDEEAAKVNAGELADALAAVLPPPVSRAAIRAEAFREAAVATRRGAFADTFDRMADAELRRMAVEAQQSAVGAPRSDTETHVYLSTGCLHGQHEYCQNTEGVAGPKKPAQCKFCTTRCVCGCHAVGARQPDTETPVVRHAPGIAILCPDCRAKGYSVCMDGEPQESAPVVPQCDGCGHLVHRARKCPAVRYGERCECDEPLATETDQPAASSAVPGRSAATDTHEETPRQSCACGQDGCEYCDVEDADEETSR